MMRFSAIATGVVAGALAANPTHYGNPATGCESDEQAVQVQGVSGDFCSPPCTSAGVCPTDEPAGDTATPQCALQTTTGGKYCALICTPSALTSNGADGECGTGTCQGIQGTGICTYASSANTKTLTVQVAANPTHYGNPATGCESDEQAVQVQGVSGNFCSPPCTSAGVCPTDEPAGDTATPQCALQTTTGGKYCALICTPSALTSNGADGECGTGTCQGIQGTGICTYASSTNTKTLTVKVAANSDVVV